MPKGNKVETAVRNVRFRGKKTKIGEQVTSLITRLSGVQILFAYILGWLDGSEKREVLLAKLEDSKILSELKRKFDEMDEEKKNGLQSAIFYLTIMGNKSHDVFYALSGKKGEEWGSVFTELRREIEKYTGAWYETEVKDETGKKKKVLKFRVGELKKLTNDQITLPESHPVNPRLFEAEKELKWLLAAIDYLEYLKNIDISTGARPEPPLRSLLDFLSEGLSSKMELTLLKLLVKAAAFKNKGHFSLNNTQAKEAWKLVCYEQELISEVPEVVSDSKTKVDKFKDGRDYQSYLAFRKENEKLLDDILELGRDGWKLFSSPLIRKWRNDPTPDNKVDGLGRKELLSLPSVKWFSKNHALYLKFRKGVTYPTYTPAFLNESSKKTTSASVNQTPEDGEEDHEHHFSWPGPRSGAKYKLLRAPSPSKDGEISLHLPFGNEEEIVSVSGPSDQKGLFLEKATYKFRSSAASSDKNNIELTLPAELKGLKIIPVGEDEVIFDLLVEVQAVPKEIIENKNQERSLIDGMVLSAISYQDDGTFWATRVKLDSTKSTGYNVLYSRPISLVQKFHPRTRKLILLEDGVKRPLSRIEFNRVMTVIAPVYNDLIDPSKTEAAKLTKEFILTECIRVIAKLQKKNNDSFIFEESFFDILMENYRSWKLRSLGKLSLIEKRIDGNISSLIEVSQAIESCMERYYYFKDLKNKLIIDSKDAKNEAERNVFKKRVRQLTRKQLYAIRTLKRLRYKNLCLRKSRQKLCANLIANFALGSIKKEGQLESKSAIVLLPEDEPRDKMKARSKNRQGPWQNHLRTLRGEGLLTERVEDHFELLGVHSFKLKTSNLDSICPECEHLTVSYVVKGNELDFSDTPKGKLPKLTKVCCSNPDCKVKGQDKGHVSALNMIHSFLRGNDYELKDPKITYADAKVLAENKLNQNKIKL